MAVKVVLKENTLRFYPESSADNSVAEYLSGLVNASKTSVSKSSEVGLDKAKADLLRRQADELDAKAHQGAYSLAKDLQEYYREKAREARELAKELDPQG